MVVITPQKTERWIITKEELDIEDTIKDQFSESISRTASNVQDLTDHTDGYFGIVHARFHGNQETSWTMQIKKIKLNAPFVSHDGIFVPMFDDKDAPNLAIDWKPPATMNLTLTACLSKQDVMAQYFVARDAMRRTWKIPISNVFDDLKLCSGLDSIRGTTCTNALKQVIDQFINSRWNQDLYASSDTTLKTNTRNMFRFKPSNDGFEQMPFVAPDDDWTLLCNKVATDEIERVVV